MDFLLVSIYVSMGLTCSLLMGSLVCYTSSRFLIYTLGFLLYRFLYSAGFWVRSGAWVRYIYAVPACAFLFCRFSLEVTTCVSCHRSLRNSFCRCSILPATACWSPAVHRYRVTCWNFLPTVSTVLGLEGLRTVPPFLPFCHLELWIAWVYFCVTAFCTIPAHCHRHLHTTCCRCLHLVHIDSSAWIASIGWAYHVWVPGCLQVLGGLLVWVWSPGFYRSGNSGTVSCAFLPGKSVHSAPLLPFSGNGFLEVDTTCLECVTVPRFCTVSAGVLPPPACLQVPAGRWCCLPAQLPATCLWVSCLIYIAPPALYLIP